jgi:BlaI family transcriptional regulator, penicillinase repressor
MNKMPKISDAEWEVMKVIWNKAPMTANEVVDCLSKRTDWNHRTIRTLLNRLVDKGAVKFQTQGQHYLFSPSISKDQCVKQESEGFIQRVFDGAASPLLAHFVKHRILSSSEIKELKQILSSKERS